MPAYVLTFTQPTSGQTFAGPGAVNAPFVLSVVRTDGGAPSFTTIPFSIPALTSPVPPTFLSLAGPTVYSGTAALPLDTGSFQAVAGWDGGPLARVDFNVDRLPPVLGLELAPGDGGDRLRDAELAVAIRSSKLLDPGTLVLTLAGTDGGVVSQAAPVAAGQCTAQGLTLGAFDRCGLLDLSTPPMGGAGFTGTFTAAVAGSDFVGNPGSSATSVPVTRLRWRGTVPGTVTVRAAPALDRQGNLIIGTQEAGLIGHVVSFSPSGALRYSVTTASVQSLAIAESDMNTALIEVVYVALQTGPSSGALRTMASDGGGLFSAGLYCADGTRQTSSAIALYDAGMVMGSPAEVAALLVFNAAGPASAGGLCSYGPTSGGTAEDGGIGLAQPVPDGTTVLSPANLVISGKKAYVQRLDKTVASIDLGPLSAGGLSSTYSLAGAPTGLAMGNGALIATWAGGSTQPIATYQLPGAASPIVQSNPDAWPTARPATVLSGAVITSTNRVGVNWLLSMSQTGTTLFAPSPVSDPVSLADFGFTSVVVGTGQRVYAVSRDGTLFVYDASATTGVAGRSPVWTGKLFINATDMVAHPTLDCSRTGQGAGRPGTLYGVSLNGQVAAIIVDSTKLEPSAPWPKWQRTAGNAGNPDFALNPGCP